MLTMMTPLLHWFSRHRSSRLAAGCMLAFVLLLPLALAACNDAPPSTDAALNEPWSLKMGDKVIFTTPRGPTARQHLNHLIHHRGQLSVYLRELDVPIPSIYGPTADERWP